MGASNVYIAVSINNKNILFCVDPLILSVKTDIVLFVGVSGDRDPTERQGAPYFCLILSLSEDIPSNLNVKVGTDLVNTESNFRFDFSINQWDGGRCTKIGISSDNSCAFLFLQCSMWTPHALLLKGRVEIGRRHGVCSYGIYIIRFAQPLAPKSL